MLTAPLVSHRAEPDDRGERRFVIHGATWEQYEAARALFDSPALRMTYLEGTLELMSPSRLHEHCKTVISRLLEAYALELEIPLNGYGSTTFGKRAKERGAEPDECYMVGVAPPLTDNDTPPHIALEVVITHSDIDKLSVYQGLGVPEVWIWHGERFTIHVLEANGYAATVRSRYLPDLDFDLLSRHVGEVDQTAAVRAFMREVRASTRNPS